MRASVLRVVQGNPDSEARLLLMFCIALDIILRRISPSGESRGAVAGTPGGLNAQAFRVLLRMYLLENVLMVPSRHDDPRASFFPAHARLAPPAHLYKLDPRILQPLQRRVVWRVV